MTHVYPFSDDGSDRIRAQVFDKRSATEAPAAAGGGSGDVVGPASATADAIALYDGTTGKLLKDSAKTFIAANLPITDAGAYFTGTDVEAALQELGAGGGGGGVSAGAQIGYIRTTSTSSASTTLTIPVDDTIPQVGEGAELTGLSTTYTPAEAASILECELTIPYMSHSAGLTMIVAVFRDGGANAVYSTFATTVAAGLAAVPSVRFTVPATSTSSTTFTVRYGTASGTTYVGRLAADYLGASDVQLFTIKEIKQ
jgi:hypothetical protein